MLEAFDRGAHVSVLAEDRVDVHARGQARDLFYRVRDAVHDRDGISVALFHHGDVHRALAVDAHDVLLNLRRVLGVTDVAEQDRLLAGADLDRYLVNRGRVVDHAVAVNEVVGRADLRI